MVAPVLLQASQPVSKQRRTISHAVAQCYFRQPSTSCVFCVLTIATLCWQVRRKWSLTGCKLGVIMYSCLHGQSPRYTSRTSAHQCPKSQHGSIFDSLLGFFGGFATPAQHTRSTGLLCRFGTLYQTAWEIRILAGTASNVCWRRICLHCTEAFSVIEMFQDDTFYKFTYLYTCAYHWLRVDHADYRVMVFVTICTERLHCIAHHQRNCNDS